MDIPSVKTGQQLYIIINSHILHGGGLPVWIWPGIIQMSGLGLMARV